MTEDWSGLTGDEMAEKLAEALDAAGDVGGEFCVCQCRYDDSPRPQYVHSDECASAAAALASYRAAVVPVLTAEAMPGASSVIGRHDGVMDDDILDALQSDADGWIKWDGGECPVPPETWVYVRFADGVEDEGGYLAKFWSNGRKNSWHHEGKLAPPRDDQIIAYRLHKEPR